MTRQEAHDIGPELEKSGWNFFRIGKKPLHTYTAEKDGVVLKASSTTALVGKVQEWISNNQPVEA